MVGGPVNATNDRLQPTVGYRVVFGSVHGYVEAYGSDAGAVSATYEIAPDVKVRILPQDVPVAIEAALRANGRKPAR